MAHNNAHGCVQKHNAFDEEGFLCVCGVLHAVLLHSSCIMAPMWMMLKALQGRFADTCLSRDCFVCLVCPVYQTIKLDYNPPKRKKKITVYVYASVTDGFCIYAARLCISGTFEIHFE